MHEEIIFQCSQCGECCRHIDRIPQLAALDSGNGVCIHLNGYLCDIYSSRPEVCQVDAMYDKYYSTYYTREEFYRLNEEACKQIKAMRLKNCDP